eukprot:261821_1
MVSINANLPSYVDISLVTICIAFLILLIYSTLKILSHCLTYGRQRGIVVILTPVYWITLFINTFMILLVIFHEIKIHALFFQNHTIENIVRLFGSYVILYLNFLMDCLILSCWFILFADLFDFTCMKKRQNIVYSIFILSVFYLMIVIVAAILIEIANISVLSLNILLYIHFLPITLNIIVFLLCIAKLPLAQPLDLSIGLYQRNTKCSCYTRITRSVWSICIIGIAQITYLYILNFDIFDINNTQKIKYFNITTNNIGLLIYFISQFIVLLWFWVFVKISIKQSFDFYTVLDAIKLVSSVNIKKKQLQLPLPIVSENNIIIKSPNNNMIIVPQQSPDPPVTVINIITEEHHGNNYQKIEVSNNDIDISQNDNSNNSNDEKKEDMEKNDKNNANDNCNCNNNNNVEMEELNKFETEGNETDTETYVAGESINDEVAPSPPLPPNISVTPMDDENVPSPQISPKESNINVIPPGNDNNNNNNNNEYVDEFDGSTMITPNVDDDTDDDNNSEPFDGATMIGGYDINEKNDKDPDAYDSNAQYDSQDGYTDNENENENENDPYVYGTMVGPYDDSTIVIDDNMIEESNTEYK